MPRRKVLFPTGCVLAPRTIIRSWPGSPCFLDLSSDIQKGKPPRDNAKGVLLIFYVAEYLIPKNKTPLVLSPPQADGVLGERTFILRTSRFSTFASLTALLHGVRSEHLELRKTLSAALRGERCTVPVGKLPLFPISLRSITEISALRNRMKPNADWVSFRPTSSPSIRIHPRRLAAGMNAN